MSLNVPLDMVYYYTWKYSKAVLRSQCGFCFWRSYE
nr:MAG TPA: hypothetical protein [Caudoviricetes sp.]DAL11111.1 MAG TPA_asm: hypothetical protein [Caudoviricetes sp.]DAQ25772.1 MAG TPA: hypothetical protein [Caudoviricetes sp.]